jgi:small conductance mechanosensitive channel
VGVAALAITFGAQTLIADILAGVFNVLEGGYRVGDYIKIDGFEGFVRSIGVRTTKVESRSRDIEIIENSQIGNVINMTPLDSVIKLMLVIPYTESLERIEAILNAELPEIGRRMEKIVEGPIYLGVSEICTGKMVPHEPSMTLLIITTCKVENYPDVERYVNREVMLLCQRENIRLL